MFLAPRGGAPNIIREARSFNIKKTAFAAGPGEWGAPGSVWGRGKAFARTAEPADKNPRKAQKNPQAAAPFAAPEPGGENSWLSQFFRCLSRFGWGSFARRAGALAGGGFFSGGFWAAALGP